MSARHLLVIGPWPDPSFLPIRLGGSLHLRLLAALTADLTNGATLRGVIGEREAQLASLAVERQKEVQPPTHILSDLVSSQKALRMHATPQNSCL